MTYTEGIPLGEIHVIITDFNQCKSPIGMPSASLISVICFPLFRIVNILCYNPDLAEMEPA